MLGDEEDELSNLTLDWKKKNTKNIAYFLRAKWNLSTTANTFFCALATRRERKKNAYNCSHLFRNKKESKKKKNECINGFSNSTAQTFLQDSF